MNILIPPPAPAFKADAELYFLPSGQFLFRSENKARFVTIQDVAAAFTGTESDSGWLPNGILRHGVNQHGPWFVCQFPAQRRTLTFDTGEVLTVPTPDLLLVGARATYHLFALAGAFQPEHPVYQAPFPNIFPDGKICWGNNAPPSGCQPQLAERVLELFFSSPFNDHLASGKSRRHPEDVRETLREQVKRVKWNPKTLQQAESSAKRLLQRLVGGGL